MKVFSEKFAAVAIFVILCVLLAIQHKPETLSGIIPRNNEIHTKSECSKTWSEIKTWNETKLCFHHIPKTGGTNFRQSPAFRKVFNELGTFRNMETKVFGHGPPKCSRARITIIRDPIERVISAYEHSRRIALHCIPGEKHEDLKCACCGVDFRKDNLTEKFKSGQMTLKDFVESEYIPKNQMSSFVLGEDVLQACNVDKFLCERIIRTLLCSEYVMVGMSEYFDDFYREFESFFLGEVRGLEEQVIWVNRTPVKIDPAKFSVSPKKGDLGDADFQAVKQSVDVDIILYKVVSQLQENGVFRQHRWMDVVS